MFGHSEIRLPLRDEQVRELHLSFGVADLIPGEYLHVSDSFDWLVINLEWTDMNTGRPRRKTVRIPSQGF